MKDTLWRTWGKLALAAVLTCTIVASLGALAGCAPLTNSTTSPSLSPVTTLHSVPPQSIRQLLGVRPVVFKVAQELTR